MTSATKKTIGAAVKKARDKKGLTQDKLCAKYKICKPAYINIEKGVRFPTYDKMITLMKKLEVRLPASIG